MNHIHELQKQYIIGRITEAEYKQKEDQYIRMMMNLYFRDFITLEELKERIK